MEQNNWKNRLTYIVFLFFIPLTVIAGSLIFKEKFYAFISLAVAVLTLLPMFYAFERKENSSGELMLLAVTVALSSVGRIVFFGIPGFKPVAAITVITAVYLGKEAGFIVGSMSAVISNFYFGQGPWTPFQMLGWGIIGLLAGVLGKYLQKSKVALYTFGAFAGFLYSAITDIWTVLMANGSFELNKYIAAAVTALPTTIMYAVSNVIFLLLLGKPVGNILRRIKTKYGLFGEKL